MEYIANIKVIFHAVDDQYAQRCIEELLDDMKHDVRDSLFPSNEEVIVSANIEKMQPTVVTVFGPANYR